MLKSYQRQQLRGWRLRRLPFSKTRGGNNGAPPAITSRCQHRGSCHFPLSCVSESSSRPTPHVKAIGGIRARRDGCCCTFKLGHHLDIQSVAQTPLFWGKRPWFWVLWRSRHTSASIMNFTVRNAFEEKKADKRTPIQDMAFPGQRPVYSIHKDSNLEPWIRPRSQRDRSLTA